MDLETITENKHKELLSLLNPLVDFMIENEYSYFIVAGKDGTCTRHLRGDYIDVHGMISGMMENNSGICDVVELEFRQPNTAQKVK